MAVRNDTQRVSKQTKKVVKLDDMSPRYTKVKVPWEFAVDLGFATKHYPEQDSSTLPVKPVYAAIEHEDFSVAGDGVIVPRPAFFLAFRAAPRHVRRRIQGVVLKPHA